MKVRKCFLGFQKMILKARAASSVKLVNFYFLDCLFIIFFSYSFASMRNQVSRHVEFYQSST